MFVPQTIIDYLENPMGKGSAAMSQKAIVKKSLEDRYDQLIEKYKDFKYVIYKKKGGLYFHFIIPSESERGNTYDVVIYFSGGKDPLGLEKDLRKLNIKVFSNCPSFVFTYAYAFNEYGMLINTLTTKYERPVLRQQPEITNPIKLINYEKSIFFALQYLVKHRKLLNRDYSNSIAKHLDHKSFSSSIRNQKQIMGEITKANLEIAKKKKKEKEKKEAERIKAEREAKRKANPKVLTGDHHIKPLKAKKGKRKIR